MLRVHTSDGLTTRFDLEDKERAAEWLERLKDPEFHNRITGLTISHRGVLYSFPRPQGFRRMSFLAERVAPDPQRKIKGGERIWCFSDDVRVGVMVHRAQRAVRVTLTKTGHRRFDPVQR